MKATFYINNRVVTLYRDDIVKDAEIRMFHVTCIGTLPWTSVIQILRDSKATTLSCNSDWFDKVVESMRNKFTRIMTEEQLDDLERQVMNPCGEIQLEPFYQRVTRVKLP